MPLVLIEIFILSIKSNHYLFQDNMDSKPTNAPKSSSDYAAELIELKDSYQRENIDLKKIKTAFDNWKKSYEFLRTNKNPNHPQIATYKALLESSKELASKHNKIVNIENRMKKKRLKEQQQRVADASTQIDTQDFPGEPSFTKKEWLAEMGSWNVSQRKDFLDYGFVPRQNFRCTGPIPVCASCRRASTSGSDGRKKRKLTKTLPNSPVAEYLHRWGTGSLGHGKGAGGK